MSADEVEAMLPALDFSRLEPLEGVVVEVIGSVESLGLTGESVQLQEPTAMVKEKSALCRPGSDAKFFCDQCEFRTNTRKSRAVHARLHTEQAQFQCSLCSYSVHTVAHLRKHENRDHRQRNGLVPTVGTTSLDGLCCPHCPYKSSSFVTLTAHLIRAKHEHIKKPNASTDRSCAMPGMMRKKVYHCPFCPYWDKAVNALHFHVVSKHGIGVPVFRCTACELTAVNRKKIMRHIRNKSSQADHSQAVCTPLHPFPPDRYASQFKVALIPKNQRRGILNSSVDNSAPPSTSALEDVLAAVDRPKEPDGQLEIQSDPVNGDEVKYREKIESTLIEMHETFVKLEEICKKGRGQESLEELRKKLEQVEEVIRQSVAETERLKEKKKELEDRTASLSSRKMQKELAYRTLQCDALKIQISAARAEGLERTSWDQILAQSQEELRKSEAALSLLDDELSAAAAEEEQLNRRISEAEESRLGAGQLVDIIQQELQSLTPTEILVADSPELKRMKESATRLVQDYLAQQENLFCFHYVQAIADVRKKESDLISQLDQYIIE